MTSADKVGVDKLADEDVVGIEERVASYYTGCNSYLTAGLIGICTGERAKTCFGAALDTAFMLIPAVKTYDIRITKPLTVVPMRAEECVDISGRGENGFCSKRKD